MQICSVNKTKRLQPGETPDAFLVLLILFACFKAFMPVWFYSSFYFLSGKN
jgi:hypothetical protein